MDFDAVCADFHTCQLPQRKEYSFKTGIQKLKASPRIREFLSFPKLTILIVNGAEAAWFLRPVNPLLLGRSEDLITEKEVVENVQWEEVKEASITGQCLPILVGFGPIYSAPLYFEPGRVPVSTSPKTDARVTQSIRSADKSFGIGRLKHSSDSFFLWNYGRAAG